MVTTALRVTEERDRTRLMACLDQNSISIRSSETVVVPSERTVTDNQIWNQAIARASEEFRSLDGLPMQREIIALSVRIMTCKAELFAIFENLDGIALCRRCSGECCRAGRYHFTAIDLLSYLVTGEKLFIPDFEANGCPFLGKGGCMIAPRFRPYNCITFLCDRLDVRMSASVRNEFEGLSGLLLELCREMEMLFANRFMYGILNNGRRMLDGRSLGILWSGNGND